VLNVEANVEVDYTALEALDQVRDELAREGTILALARVKQDLLVRLEAFGLAKRPALTCCSPPCPPPWPPTAGEPPATLHQHPSTRTERIRDHPLALAAERGTMGGEIVTWSSGPAPAAAMG
jgi:MFS superfamily sulfate permease-like transporter